MSEQKSSRHVIEMDPSQSLEIKKFIEDRSVPITESGCWVWEGCSSHARIAFGDQRVYIVRLAYAAFKGKLDPCDTIVHKCHIGCCVNPAHLEKVTH